MFSSAFKFATDEPIAALRWALRYARRVKHHCPICKKPTDSETDAEFPFCSQRCRLLDLGNWASEKYVVSEPAMDEDSSEISERDPDEPTN
ncbi:MAG: DNA gyrase inhibitor YacG [Candidatus Acidiferrales bacterium]